MKVMFSFDSDKMKALKMYTEQKGISIEDELEQAAEGLYQKHVPASVKAFIANKSKVRRPKEKAQDISDSAVGSVCSGD